jgi:hypothetical protein
VFCATCACSSSGSQLNALHETAAVSWLNYGECFEITPTDITICTVGSPIQGALDGIEAIRSKRPFAADSNAACESAPGAEEPPQTAHVRHALYSVRCFDETLRFFAPQDFEAVPGNALQPMSRSEVVDKARHLTTLLTMTAGSQLSVGDQNYIRIQDMADRAIAIAPVRPFFMDFAPGSDHASRSESSSSGANSISRWKKEIGIVPADTSRPERQ